MSLQKGKIRPGSHPDNSPYGSGGGKGTGHRFSPENFDNFDVGGIATEFDNQYYVSADPVDQFLGLGNKTKKAAKKVKKAEKQLAKGHVKKAEKKARKAEKLQGKVTRAQQDVINAQAGQDAIKQNAATIESNKLATSTPQTDAAPTAYDPLNTSAAGKATPAEMAMTGGGGGGGGDYPDTSTDAPEEDQTPDQEMTQAADVVETEEDDDDPITAFFKSLFGFDSFGGSLPPDTPTGTLAQTKTLGGVTIVAHKKKKGKMILPVLIIVGLIIIFRKKLFK